MIHDVHKLDGQYHRVVFRTILKGLSKKSDRVSLVQLSNINLDIAHLATHHAYYMLLFFSNIQQGKAESL